MCLRPIKIRNKSLTIGQSDWTQYELTVPCMQCAECKQLMRDQWYLRAYWQAKYTFDNNGWVLFDTLTYDDAHLPHLSDTLPQLRNSILDFPCFSHEHTRRFWVDVRQALDRAGYRTDFSYFLCSEYGTDPTRTNRPHYHILVYNVDPALDPETMSNIIAKCWKYGRTDGVPYKGSSYVVNRNVFGPRYDTDIPHMQAVCGYVMKYITKDSDFESRIKYRLNTVMDRLVSEKYPNDVIDWQHDACFKEEYRKVKRLVSQFHRQSQHFGEYALSNYDIEEILTSGVMDIPDCDSVVKHIPLPQYYSRKLFCTQVKMEDGRRVWIPTELGKRYRYRRTYQGAALFCRRLNNWFNNLPTSYILPSDEFFLPDGTKFTFSPEECQEAAKQVQRRFLELLHGRSMLDVATYAMFYRGRIIPRDNLLSPDKLHPQDVVSSALSASPFNTMNVYKYRVYVDRLTGEEIPFMSLVPDEDFVDAAERRLKGQTFDVDVVTVDTFKKHFVVNDTTFPEYDGFDELLDLYEESLKIQNRRKQQTFDHVEKVSKVMKQFRKI